MDINLISQNFDNMRFFQVQNYGNQITLIEISNSKDSQTQTINALATLIESGMFAVYNRNANRVYFNDKVYQEVQATSPGDAKVANLRKVIMPSLHANDEINSADIDVMDEKLSSDLKLVVSNLKAGIAILEAEKSAKSEEKEGKATKIAAKATKTKYKASSANQAVSSQQSSSKQKSNSTLANEDRKSDEKAYQKERNKRHAEEEAERKALAIAQKREVFELKKLLGIL